MWVLISILLVVLIMVCCAYRALYADSFAYEGRHRGSFKFDFDSIKGHTGVLTLTQAKL
jgi:hypothetical protein